MSECGVLTLEDEGALPALPMAQLLAGPSLTTASPSWDIVTVDRYHNLCRTRDIMPLFIKKREITHSMNSGMHDLYSCNAISQSKMFLFATRDLAANVIRLLKFNEIQFSFFVLNSFQRCGK